MCTRGFIIFDNMFLLFVLIYVAIATTSHGNFFPNESCSQRGVTLACDHHIPIIIPKDAKEVYVHDYITENIDSTNFEDPSWLKVTKLDIIVNINIHLHLKDFDFIHLKNLKYLNIRSPNLQVFAYEKNDKAFEGLNQLTHLNLSNCQKLSSDAVTKLINNTLPNITSLDLKGLNTYNGRALVLTKEFVEVLKSKPIRWLSLSGTNILCLSANEYNKLDDYTQLEYLDVSNTTLIFNGRPHMFFNNILNFIKTLDISFAPIRLFNFEFQIYNRIIKKSLQFPMLEHIYANNLISHKPIIVNNVTVDGSTSNLPVKTLEIRGNKIHKVNATVIWPTSTVQTMRHLDLSSNEILYLSPCAFNGLSKLTHLLLSNNSLNNMERVPEMSEMFKTFHDLAHMSLGYNHFTSLPYDVFLNNTNLQSLLLNGNNFQVITFKLGHLRNLQVIDFRGNRLKFLAGEGLIQLQQLLQHMKNRTTRFKHVIKFENNPLECTCESVDFFDWIYKQFKPFEQNMLTCNLEGRILNIDRNSLNKTKFLCHRHAVIAASCLSCLIILMIICAVAFITKRYKFRRKIKRDFQQILEEFNDNKLDMESIIYLSATDDDDNALDYVYNQLNNTLKAKYKISTNIICLGQVHFKYGFHVIDNIMRCVDQTLVTIFITSNTFCRNSECRMELKEAYMKEKPIILIFKEPILKGLLDTYPYLYTVIHRSKTFKLDRVATEYTLTPGLNKFVNLIALMAIEEQRQKQRQLINEEEENSTLL